MSSYQLFVTEADGNVWVVDLKPSRSVTIGRSRTNDIVLSRGHVSSCHAAIRPGEDCFLLRDLGSRNGTLLNGTAVEGEVRFGAGDRVEIGATVLKLVPVADVDQGRVKVVDGWDTHIVATLPPGAVPAGAGRGEAVRALERAQRNLTVLHEMGGVLLEAADGKEMCDRILHLVFEFLPADRACLILRPLDGSDETRTVHTRSEESTTVVISGTILGKSIEHGLSVLTADAAGDERFRRHDSVVSQGIRAAMCVPLRGRQATHGAIYVDTLIQKGVFSREDLELLTSVGIQGGIALENQQLHRKNLAAERLAATGNVVAGLAHDIRNILTVLRGGAQLVDERVAQLGDGDLRECWSMVRDSTNTIGRLVGDMVSYSKHREPVRRPTDLHALVTTVLGRCEDRAKRGGVRLERSIAPLLPVAHIDDVAIDRVLTNLVVNALDALGAREGCVRVSADSALDGRAVELAVSDDGPGIRPEHLGHVFDLLFSTKGSNGTGFGLAIAKKVVEEHGGTIRAESEVGKGATIRILLPLQSEVRDVV